MHFLMSVTLSLVVLIALTAAKLCKQVYMRGEKTYLWSPQEQNPMTFITEKSMFWTFQAIIAFKFIDNRFGRGLATSPPNFQTRMMSVSHLPIALNHRLIITPNYYLVNLW